MHTPNNALWDGLAGAHPPVTILAYSSMFFCIFLTYVNFFKFKNFVLFKLALYKHTASVFAISLLLGSW
jgi:hypothetical protein